jgi:hypothetical protein
MSTTKKALQAVIALAFLVAMFALALGEIVPHPEDIEFKLTQTVSKATNYDIDLKVNPKQAAGYPAYSPDTEYLWEGFDDGTVPPPDWTAVVNNAYTWEIDDYAPYEGAYNATCLYDETYTGPQDEWLISPSMDFSAKANLKLTFWFNGSYYWGVDPYDNYDLVVKVSTNGGTDWDSIWVEDDYGPFDSWVWNEAIVPLPMAEGYSDCKVAFVYVGYDGAQWNIDAIQIDDDPLPVGRCCYGDPYAPTCEDIIQTECDALGGDWDESLNCTDNPCPVAEGNDECVGAYDVPGPYPALVEGNTFGATIDCPGVLDWNAVWYKFDAPYVCNNVSMDYCNVPTVQNVECLGVVVFEQCDDCPNYILYSSNEWVDCPPAPTSQPITHFDGLPGPATYYYPVFMGDAACDPIEAEFAFMLDILECPPPEPGDNCGDPLLITLPADLDYLNTNYTCGRTDFYNATCLGYYDGGEDIIYEVTVTSAVDVDIKLDPKGTTYTGFAVDYSCPLDPTTCYAEATNSGSNAYTISGLHLDPGTYYIMVDTWPSPACIPDFDLEITVAAGPTPGDDCTDPIIVKVPADLPYADLGQTNCGRGNDYSSTCLGSYDGGEDIIYQIDVTANSVVTITMDPKGSTWTGLVIDDACPPGDPCIEYSTGSSGSRVLEDVALAPGTYYIMVDTWPSPNCLPDFDLFIEAGADPPVLAYTPSQFDFTANFAGEFGDDILTLENTGGADLDYSVVVSYAKSKEIDGAYIIALDDYIAGSTMDIEFELGNASSDAEWLDGATITFPTGITVNSSTDFIVATNPSHLLTDMGTAAQVSTWADTDGGYGNIYSTEIAYTTMNLTFDGSFSGPITCDFTVSGDDYGSPPHDVSGNFDIEEYDPTTSWLTVVPLSGTIPGSKATEDLTVSWNAAGLAPGVYTASIEITSNGGNGTIPVTLTVLDGLAATFVPDPAYMYYMFAYTPIMAYVDVTTAGTVTYAEVNGVPATILGQGGGVVNLEVPIAPVLVGYGAPIGSVPRTFSVAGDFDDATTFTGGGVITVIGRNPANLKAWILPPDIVILHGDADASGNIDIDDVVTMIGFIFGGEMLPGPVLIADCDCSANVDIDDVVYMITYIFGSGPPPCIL